MPLPDVEWITNLPTSQDVVGTEQPNLADDSAPGAQDGNRVKVSHVQALRKKAQYNSETIGDASSLPSGCLKEKVTALESAPPTHATSHNAGQPDALAIDEAAATGSLRTLGASATSACAGTDSRLGDARVPTTHALSHKSAGGDAVRIDELKIGTDVTTLDASLSEHGLLKKLGGGTTNFLRADGTWSAPPGGTDTNAIHKSTASEIHGVTAKATPVAADEILIEDSADTWNKKRIALTNLLGGSSPLTTKGDIYTRNVTVDARLAIGTDGYVLTADAAEATGLKWAAASGGGFTAREEEFTAAGGDENFTLAATPAVNANTLSGRNILGVYRNGVRLRYQASPAAATEFGYTATVTINCKSLTTGDIITVVYGS
jgi:hypothetical protein